MKSRMNYLIVTLCFIVLSGVINAILFNMALEDMIKDLSVTSSAISWIVISYTLVITFGSITYSKLASYIQIKKLLMIGVLLFALGSVIGYLSNGYIGVLIGRVIQAMGGSSFIALSMITANQYLPLAKRNVTLTLIGGCLSLGSGFGFLMGGILTHIWGWPSLFLFMSLTLLTVFGLYYFVPSGYAGNEKVTKPFDFFGLFYLLLFVISFILGVKLNGYLLILSVLSILLLNLHSKKQGVLLFIDFSVFQSYSFNKLILISFINNAAMVAILFLFPLQAIRTFHVSVILIGFILCSISIVGFLISLLVRKTVHFISNKKLMVISIGVQLIGFGILIFLGLHSMVMITLGVLFIYISFSALTVIVNIEIPHTIEKEKMSMGLGVYNLFNFLGMSFGPSISSRLLEMSSNLNFSFSFFAGLLILSFVLSIVKQKSAG
ncbi:MFS transporter [Priestia megaterium]|jgi:MFS transporter, DHA2 family, metal-tetracycline-proton antiporter|uniref:MFS transporter n=1 Tax=Priestia megaterium TaxID=1404 RepID=UPI000BA7916A|nr:MFS transporter [Priestia megaterium]MBU8757642.1 MFS transporter [Priestia megaterium]MDQ0805021.1 DHA2 family metal-tetracycline-proton antiporter-like MFS transporter [Priestia megaterium]PAK42350.1 MFS transporter [Priestia megaterium]